MVGPPVTQQDLVEFQVLDIGQSQPQLWKDLSLSLPFRLNELLIKGKEEAVLQGRQRLLEELTRYQLTG